MSAIKPRKSPASDGLLSEFYTCFWNILCSDLVEALNESFQSGKFSESMRLAIISLIFKKGDRLLLKNWRPISLLNVNYKIGAKVLATRLKSVLPSLLNPDQTCNVPGRTIVDSLCLIRDSITYVNQKQIPLALIKIDQEKAFDCVNLAFLDSIFIKMNIGPTFRKFITSLYTEVMSCVLNNGHKSRAFFLEREEYAKVALCCRCYIV